MIRFAVPLVIFLAMAGLLWKGLGLDPRELPSQLIDKPAPAFSVASVQNPDRTVSDQTLRGEVWVLNVWASWCVACLQEHAIISELATRVPVVGLNYKDERQAAIDWLGKHGNPYRHSAYDNSGDVGIDYGVYGVPETFVIDRNNRIRYKHTGPVSREALESTLLPILDSLRAEQAG